MDTSLRPYTFEGLIEVGGPADTSGGDVSAAARDVLAERVFNVQISEARRRVALPEAHQSQRQTRRQREALAILQPIVGSTPPYL
jgi:hypothetical protein